MHLNFLIPQQFANLLLEECCIRFSPYLTKNKDGTEQLIDIKKHFETYLETMFLEEWSLGGTYGSCWDDELHEVSSDDEPDMNEFNKFVSKNFSDDDIIDKIHNNLYHFIDQNTEYDNDYYGGSTSKAIKTINLENLTSVFLNDNIINQDNLVIFSDYLDSIQDICLKHEIFEFSLSAICNLMYLEKNLNTNDNIHSIKSKILNKI